MRAIESLESRRLLTAATLVPAGEVVAGQTSLVAFNLDAIPKVSLVDGVLKIEGSLKSDTMSVGKDGKFLVLNLNPDTLTLTSSAQAGTVSRIGSAYTDGTSNFSHFIFGSGKFNLADIDRIEINGNKGNDLITVSDKVNIPVFITGGVGNDTIVGGSGDDQVSGGKGNDSVLGSLGDDIVHGNDGDDFVDGGKGYNQVLGDKGNDSKPRKVAGVDYLVTNIEIHATDGASQTPVTDLSHFFDGLSIVKKNGELFVETQLDFKAITASINWGEAVRRLNEYDIDISAVTSSLAHSNNVGRLAPWSTVTFVGGATGVQRKAYNLGRLGEGPVTVTIRSGKEILGTLKIQNTGNFQGDRLDPAKFIAQYSSLPSVDKLVNPQTNMYFGIGTTTTLVSGITTGYARVGTVVDFSDKTIKLG